MDEDEKVLIDIKINNKRMIDLLNSETNHKEVTFVNSFYDSSFIDKVFDNCTFKSMELRNLTFQNCRFTKCTFDYVKMRNVKFINCTISASKFVNCLLKIEFMNKCKIMTTEFCKCNLDNEIDLILYQNNNNLIVLKKGPEQVELGFLAECTVFFSVGFRNTNLESSIFDKCSLDVVEFYDNTSLLNAEFKNIRGEFNIRFSCDKNIKMNKCGLNVNDYITRVDDRTLFPDYKEIKKIIKNSDKGTLKGLINSYYAICNIRRQNHVDENIIGESMYIYKALYHITLTGRKKSISFLVKCLNGYGEKWHFGLLWSISSIVILAFCYMSGLQVNGTLQSETYLIKYTLDLGQILNTSSWKVFLKDFASCLYFSMMTFTTVGYGNMQAIGIFSNIISFAQMFFGGVLMTITTGTLLRKILR